MVNKAVACCLAAVMGGVLVSAVGAVASTKSSGAKACVTSKGVLTLESHGKCPSGSTAAKLGAQGPAGATGPSDAYSSEILSYGGGAQGPSIGYRSETLITKVVVPAGSYLVTGDADIAGPQTGNDNYACELNFVTSKGILQGREANRSTFGQYSGYDDVSVAEPVALPKGGDIQFLCESVNNNSAERPQVSDATLIAQTVGDLHAHGDLPKVTS